MAHCYNIISTYSFCILNSKTDWHLLEITKELNYLEISHTDDSVVFYSILFYRNLHRCFRHSFIAEAE